MFPESRATFLTSQILPPKRSSRRPRQELADYLLTPCVQPSLRRLSSTYSQSSAKFNCRFASRPICHVRAGSALPSIEDLDERSRGNATSSPAAATSTRMLEIITARKTLSISANAGCLFSFQFWQDRRATRAHRKNPGLSGSVQAGAGFSIGRTHGTGPAAVEVEGRSRHLEASAESERPEQLVRRPGSRWPA